MSEHYILDADKNPVVCSLFEWVDFFENIENRRVAADTFDGVHVSTVFLGMDHRFGDEGPPILFETMIFEHGKGGLLEDEYQTRCSTWAEAVEMHDRAVKHARSLLKARQASQ